MRHVLYLVSHALAALAVAGGVALWAEAHRSSPRKVLSGPTFVMQAYLDTQPILTSKGVTYHPLLQAFNQEYVALCGPSKLESCYPEIQQDKGHPVQAELTGNATRGYYLLSLHSLESGRAVLTRELILQRHQRRYENLQASGILLIILGSVFLLGSAFSRLRRG